MGPTASVLLPAPLTVAGLERLGRTLATISEPIPELDQCYWVRTTVPVGGTHIARAIDDHRPFSLGVQRIVVTSESDDDDLSVPPEPAGDEREADYYTAGQIAAVEASFGLRPAQSIGVGANCNRDDDHRILAELCIHLAEHLGGVVGLGGILYGRVPPYVARGFRGDLDARWRQQEQYVAAATATLPGRCVVVEREQFCDPAFLRASLNHPLFYMIK